MKLQKLGLDHNPCPYWLRSADFNCNEFISRIYRFGDISINRIDSKYMSLICFTL